MSHLQSKLYRLFGLGIACFYMAKALGGQAQSDAAQQLVPALEVISATLNPNTNEVSVQLKNGSIKPVTAFGLQISFMQVGKVVQQFSQSVDLLDPVLNARCAGSTSTSTDTWSGSVLPGTSYTDVFSSNLTAPLLAMGAPTVAVRVAGAIWSDGSGEGDSSTAGFAAMQEIQQQREDVISGEGRLVALIHRHSEPDIRTRLNAITSSVQTLEDVRPQVVTPQVSTAKSTIAPSSRVYTPFLQNMSVVSTASDPESAFRAFDTFFECRYNQRVSILQSVNTIQKR